MEISSLSRPTQMLELSKSVNNIAKFGEFRSFCSFIVAQLTQLTELKLFPKGMNVTPKVMRSLLLEPIPSFHAWI